MSTGRVSDSGGLLHSPTVPSTAWYGYAFASSFSWILAGRMPAPLTRITEATRMAANGPPSHRIRLPGRSDEFREIADASDAMLARLEAHVAEQRRAGRSRSPRAPPGGSASRWTYP